ncbi:MAG: SagB/ThcOx family dehydrogenase [Polyangiaceae bacterium]|nr:SagB/ThcOx family dehydrogenase [Polyangiaceae bacterium]
MAKLLLVATPLALYFAAYAVRALLGHRPSRHALNVELALMLVLYFFATAGLGVFWVANQQLPPFDLHYLCGYTTVVLVVAHLVFNWKTVVAYVRKGPRPAKHPIGRAFVAKSVGAALLAGASFFLGMRAGSPRLPSSFGGEAGPSLAAIEQYHAMSSHSRAGVVLRAPSVAWDVPVARYLDRGDRPRISLAKPDTGRGKERAIVEALAGVPTVRTQPFDLTDLATLLWATAGITDRRGGQDLRASASSGALFPTEIYVLASGVDGLPDGTYAYAPDDHALVDLGREPELHPAMGIDNGSPPKLVLVATSVFRRTGQKYRDRAYRYATADAGHTLGNAVVAAAELGLSTELVPRFDESSVAAAVGADNVREGVLAVIALREGGATKKSSSLGLFASSKLADPAELELGATGLAHIATSLRYIGDPATSGEATPLAPPPGRRARVLDLIGARRSVRNFSNDPIAETDLGSVLGVAAAVPPLLSHAVRVHVVGSRVAGIAPGTFRYDPGRGELIRTKSGDAGKQAGDAALNQDVIGNAPVAIVLTLDRGVLSSEGARGYRHAFLEAGMLGARLYLAAEAFDLGGCSVGAFYDEETSALLGVDSEAEWPIHFFGLGKRQ